VNAFSFVISCLVGTDSEIQGGVHRGQSPGLS